MKLNKKFILKTLIYALLLLVLAAIQTQERYALRIMGAAPDLLLCAAMSAAVFEQGRYAAVTAFVAGFLSDCAFGAPYLMSGLLLFICAYAGAYAAERYLGKRLFTALALTALAAALRGALNVFVALGLWKNFDLPSLLVRVILPEFALTVAFAVPVYFAVKYAAARVEYK